MLRRKVYDNLLEWKNKPHKCLVITGQRQVGKTFIIDNFAKSNYEHYIYINFNDSPEESQLFDGNINIEEIIRRLTLRFGPNSLVEGSTLIFLDEIQDCPMAYSSLKQFTQYGKFDVIASGSLLGVKMPSNNAETEPLIPMGYEERIVMRPLDFEEYLWARDFPMDEIAVIRKCIREKRPLDGFTLKRTTELYREYVIVGGMPEAVQSFVTSKDFRDSDAVQSELVATCHRDINRYNRNSDCIRTTECFDSIPNQLANTNKKYMYSRIKNGQSRQSSDMYSENLLWIKNAGYGLFCFGLQQPAMPLKNNIKPDLFKVYLSDTGCLLHEYGDKTRMAVYNGDHAYNNGAIIENAVADGIVKSGYGLFYYTKRNGIGKMELDFVLEFWDGIAAIEVKSGRTKQSNSLDKVNDFFDVRRRIKLEESNIFVDEKGIEHYPLFACAFIDEMDPQKEGPKFSY